MSGLVNVPLTGIPADQLPETLAGILGRAGFEHMCAAMGPNVRVKPWDQLTDSGHRCYIDRYSWLVPTLVPLVTVPFVVGARDTLDGQPWNYCLAPSGQFECTRARHDQDPETADLHATGDGDFIVAVWRAVL